MTNPLAQDLGGVVRLLEKATPGSWRAGFMHDGEFVESATDGGALQKGDGSFLAVSKTANGYNYQDAKAIAACVNFLRTHSAEIAGALRDAERYRWLRMRLAAEELDNEDAARMALSMVGPIRFRPADSDYCGELDTAIDSAMQQGGGGGGE